MGTSADSASKDLLLADYRHLAESFWNNEKTGETRVSLFIGLVTLVIGALVTLVASDDPPGDDTMRIIVMLSLFGLLMLGVITWLRILKRNETTDRYKCNSA